MIQNQGCGGEAEHRGRVRWHLDLKHWRKCRSLLLSLVVSYLFGIPIRDCALGQDRQPTVSLRLGFDKTSQ